MRGLQYFYSRLNAVFFIIITMQKLLKAHKALAEHKTRSLLDKYEEILKIVIIACKTYRHQDLIVMNFEIQHSREISKGHWPLIHSAFQVTVG